MRKKSPVISRLLEFHRIGPTEPYIFQDYCSRWSRFMGAIVSKRYATSEFSLMYNNVISNTGNICNKCKGFIRNTINNVLVIYRLIRLWILDIFLK